MAITFTDHDRTRTFLLLHGGGGPPTVAAFGERLAAHARARVIVPTHPGFAGTERPAELSSVAALARAYLALLAAHDLQDVTVIGNSLGGWIAAEMGLANTDRRVGALVLVDAVGPVVPDHPPTDVRGLAPHELAALSWHRPPPPNPNAPKPDIAALLAYTGPAMSDPTLLDRLHHLTLPTHVLWGESDRIVTPAYGRAIAAAIPNARFTLLPASGHLPQLEAPDALLAAIAE